MRVKVYKAMKSPSNSSVVYVFIEEDKDIKDIDIPVPVKDRLGDLRQVNSLEINHGEKRIALDADDAINNINKTGYHIQGVGINLSLADN